MGEQNEGSNISSVSLVRCQTYDNSNIEAAIEKALNLIGGIESYVKPGDRVLLKINLLTGDVPEKAVTTHPEIVRAMIHQVKSSGGIPQVGDCGGSEGASNRNRYFAACRSSGIMQVCEEEDTEIMHLNAESIDAKNPSGRIFKSFILSKLVLQADVMISLPKLKKNDAKNAGYASNTAHRVRYQKKMTILHLIIRNVSDATAVRNYVRAMLLN